MKKRVVAKAKKRHRRNRQEFARVNDLYFEDRHPKDVPLPTSDDAGLGAMAMMLALATNKRSRTRTTEEPDLTAEQLRLRAVERAKEAQGESDKNR